MPSIKGRLGNARSTKENTEIRALLASVQADLETLRAQPRDFKTVNDQDFGAETATRIAEASVQNPISIINPDPRGRDWANMD